ncbi:MAG: hypothetical protein WC496_00950 [Phycisphaerae bacterium]|jgi:hypothetical protein
MANNEKLRRWGLDKAAFFGLLLLGLLLAKLLISSRTDFKLSEPVGVKGTGLTVSVPADGGWKSLSDSFKYEDNEFRLASLMQINSNSAISLRWRYLLQPSQEGASQQFEAMAASVQGKIESVKSEKFGDFTFDYAQISSEKAVVLCGTTVLPDGKVITLEVAHKGLGGDLAEKIFKALLASVKYLPDNPLTKGVEFLKNFKASYSEILPRQGHRDYYHIKDTRGNTIGFSTDSISYSADSNDDSAVTFAGISFISSSYNTYTEQTVFHSDISLRRFDWTIKQGSLLTNRQQPTHIQLDDENVLTVQKNDVINKFYFTDSMVPDVIFDRVVAEFLKSKFDTVMLEIILSDGKIAPVILSRIKTSETSVLPAQSAAQVEFFGAYTVHQKMYFDGQKGLLSAEIQGSFSYRLERTTRADILADFPQWLDKIQMMEQYQMKKGSKDIKK